MPEEVDNSPKRVRISRRRTTGLAFSPGGLSASSQGGGVADHPDDDPEVADLNAQVRDSLPAVRTITEEQQAELMRMTANSEEFNPQSRLAQVRARSSNYEREYRLQLLHRLLMRKLPLDEVAANLGVSVSTVLRDRRELQARLRSVAKELDIEEMIGDSKGFYEEVQAMAMRAASSGTVPMPMRLAAMRTALASHNDMHRFMQAAGVYDVLRFRKGAAGGAVTDIQKLMQLTEDMLADARKESPAANPLGEFSGNDSEVLDL